MSKHPDLEDASFDDFIRQSMQEPPIPFDPKAWEAMEQKLDALSGGQSNGQKGGSKGGRIAGLVAVLLMLSGLAWFVFSGEEKQDMGTEGNQQSVVLSEQVPMEEKEPAINSATKSVPAENTKETPVQEEVIGPSSSTASASDVLNGSEKSIKEKNEFLAQKSGRKVTIAENSAIAEGKVEAVAAAEKKDVDRITATNRYLPAPGSDAQLRKSAVAATGPSEGFRKQTNDGEVQAVTTPEGLKEEEQLTFGKGANKAVVVNGILRAETASGGEISETAISSVGGSEEQETKVLTSIERRNWLPLVFGEPILSLYPLTEKEAREETRVVVPPSKAQEGPFSVSVTLAPDFTGTGRQGSTKMGAGVGLQFEYKILARLSVVSGAFYSKKNYLTDNSFSPYGKFWEYRPEPDHIDASCGVIDIPLNLRYYALIGTKHRLFLSGGMSSYFMQSEDYTLVYTDGQWEDYTYEVRNQNHHLFAVYNLSAGYERNISSRFALELEPFMKIPAQGVGIGSVKLNSMGAFVHLKYKISRLGK